MDLQNTNNIPTVTHRDHHCLHGSYEFINTTWLNGICGEPKYTCCKDKHYDTKDFMLTKANYGMVKREESNDTKYILTTIGEEKLRTSTTFSSEQEMLKNLKMQESDLIVFTSYDTKKIQGWTYHLLLFRHHI
jgi:hypothetical protein